LTAAVAACSPPPDVDVTVAATGLNRPWDIAYTPGGNYFVTERAGRVNLDYFGQRRTVAAPADVVVSGEGGMLGVAVDPAFSTNRRVYTCFLSNLSGTIDVRIARWRLDDTSSALVDRTDIVTGIQANPTGRHPGCRMRFGPDGHLWVGTGDAATGSTPQDPRSLAGKVLRVTTDGQPAPGNPGGALDPRIYTYGHRNVQGLAFDRSGRAYAIEHGTDRDDEVNLLVAGGNYGWDPVPPGGGPGYDESQPMTDTTKFPNARQPVWASGFPTIAPSGGTFVNGTAWGSWDGALVLATLKGQHIEVIGMNADGTASGLRWAAVSGRGRLRTAVQGPTGDLFIATDATAGSILRLTPRAALATATRVD
jgi:glucose/arabinose dehydrogenase